MDQKKLEKLENIKNYLENDDINGLTKYVERIKPAIKEDEDFNEIFDELKNKNYDQALFITEDILLDADDEEDDFKDEYDKVDFDDLDSKDEMLMDEPGENLEDLEDFNDDFNDDQFDDDFSDYGDKEDDYYNY